MREVTVRTSSVEGAANAHPRPTPERAANGSAHRPWLGALRRGAAALLLGVGLGGAGCQVVTGVDRDQIPGAGGATATGGGQGGAAGQGGGGAGSLPCAGPADCPGADDECQTRTCAGGACGVHYAPKNTPTSAQAASDCRRNVCDGQGHVVSIDDDLDVLVDGDPCSSDVCVAGTPANPPAPAATECAEDGGRFCDGNGACVECLIGGDCVDGICVSSACVAATCGDGVQNGEEADVDCGGPDCARCADLKSCWFGSDCQSQVCKNGKCEAPACNDGFGNGQETDVDCGGPACPKCAAGKGCSVHSDCHSDLCSGTTCLPTCTDLEKDGAETDVDCGGPTCPTCDTGESCALASDCASGVCADGRCTPPPCGDGIVNGAEACDDGNSSNTDDCLNSCQLPTCGDGHVRADVEPCDDGDADNDDACLVGCILPACGDGHLWSGVEGCDDGDTVSGDGCSSTCAIETCGDGVVDDLEACDDGNSSDLDACLSDCRLATCGDGHVYGGVEACDDANANANDGCARLCTVEAPYTCAGTPSVCTSPVEIHCNDGLDNDGDGSIDCSDPNCSLGCDPSVGPCAAGESLLVYASTDTPRSIPDGPGISLTSPVHAGGLGKVTRAVAQLNVAHTQDTDLDIYLKSPAGVNVELSTDNGGTGDNYTRTIFSSACPDLIRSGAAPFAGCYQPEGDLAAFDGGPAKGSWMLDVADDAGDNIGTLGFWRLSICVAPSTCGDGSLDASEPCDDGGSAGGDGCAGTCAVEPGFICAGSPSACTPICGDGLVVSGEPCDDGNAVNGDGCSTACAREPGYACSGSPSTCVIGDVEPNDSSASADARAGDPFPMLITGDTVYGGAIQAVGDQDFYKMTLATASVVRFETFDATGGDCPSGMKTALTLWDETLMTLYSDNGSGIRNCSAITANVPAGTYYVSVEELGNDELVAAYRLEVKIQSDRGAEAEVNDTPLTANALNGSNVYILGGHQVNADSDYFAIPVPVNGMSIVAEIIEGAGETCESSGVDSRLTLYNAVPAQLADDDHDGRGLCSKIDGTGSAPLDPGAHHLPAGTYYLQVRASAAGAAPTGPSGQFDYKLVVAVR